MVRTQELHALIDKDHLGEGLLMATDVSTACAKAIFRSRVFKVFVFRVFRVFRVRYLPHRLSKRRSPTTVPLRTPITKLTFSNQGFSRSVYKHLSLVYLTLFDATLVKINETKKSYDGRPNVSTAPVRSLL